MGLIEKFQRKRAIKSYIKELPRLLVKDYGRSRTYTPKQVKKTIERHGLNVTYACYGIAMFSGRESFDDYHQEIGEPCSYEDMRCEIAYTHFKGNSEFDISDVAYASSSFGGGFDAGGFDGGGGEIAVEVVIEI